MKRGFTLVEVLVSLAILATLAGLIIPGCAAVAEANRKARQNPDKAERSFYLSTERHDGHMWVMNRTMDYFIHHPDCPCKEKAERE